MELDICPEFQRRQRGVGAVDYTHFYLTPRLINNINTKETQAGNNVFSVLKYWIYKYIQTLANRVKVRPEKWIMER